MLIRTALHNTQEGQLYLVIFNLLSPKGSRLRSALLSTVALSSNFGPSSNFHFGDPVDDIMPLSVCHRCEDGCNSAGIRDLCNSISDYQ